MEKTYLEENLKQMHGSRKIPQEGVLWCEHLYLWLGADRIPPLFSMGFICDRAVEVLQIFAAGLAHPESSSTGYSRHLNRHAEEMM